MVSSIQGNGGSVPYFPGLAVVTTIEQRKGRGLALQPSPVKRAAQDLGLEVLEPENPNTPEFVAALKALNPDLIVLAAYGFILKPELLAVPKKGCLNLHPSLLPRYRGAAPIQRAIMAGETETGVSVFLMNEKIDQGDVIMQNGVMIGLNETSGELTLRLAELAATMLPQALALVAQGVCPRIVQDPSQACYARKIAKEERLISWNRPARELHNLVRGLSPAPSAFTFFRSRRLEILGTESFEARTGIPGELVVEGRNLYCGTGMGSLLLTRVKPEAGKLMSGADLINGRRIRSGEKLGEP